MSSIVLDTNCLIAILPSRSPYHSVWNDLLEGRTKLCVSSDILLEYEEILFRKTRNQLFVDSVMKSVLNLPGLVRKEPEYRFGIITADPDDNKFVDCAICSGAMCIVSNDAHFRILKEIDFPRVNLYTLQEYVAEFNH